MGNSSCLDISVNHRDAVDRVHKLLADKKTVCPEDAFMEVWNSRTGSGPCTNSVMAVVMYCNFDRPCRPWSGIFRK